MAKTPAFPRHLRALLAAFAVSCLAVPVGAVFGAQANPPELFAATSAEDRSPQDETPQRSNAQGQKKQAARAQFEHAEDLRADLEANSRSDRSLPQYKRVVEAYRRVYLITPQSPEVTAALMAMADLYQQMGRQFDPLYFHSAIDTYQFLLQEYPGSRHCEEALLAIAQIERDDLHENDAARQTLQDFVRRFPQSARGEEVRQALAVVSRRQYEAKRAAPEPAVEEANGNHQAPRVTAIHHWNSESYTRVVIDVDGPVKYQSARIPNPDRIYFDLYKAGLSPALSGKTQTVGDGFLKAIRVAQNQAGVVRVVLDLDKLESYSAFVLQNPYRMVIDIRGEAPLAAKAAAAKPSAATENGQGSEPKPEKLEPASPPPAPQTLGAKRATIPVAREAAMTNPSPVPQPTHAGDHSLTRALGLKIGRIVVDAGHGGHDTGTVGPAGLMEKDLCLDVALRLGKLLQTRLPGAEVIYTRADDTFIPLEDRTALANQEKADLFISIHANSSHDQSARGIETYYLNFASSPEALEVAARENALSQSSVHDLQDLIKRIARNEKVEESREFAIDVQDSLVGQLKRTRSGSKSRGVKKAPFVVLIGANMPSVLAEISFLSNPSDERLLKKPDQRQRVAQGLFNGIVRYLASLNSLTYNQEKASPQPAVLMPQ